MKVHLDLETRCEVDLVSSGLHKYARGQHADFICASFAFDDGPIELWKLGDPAPLDLLFHIQDGGEVVAHNAPFELEMWREVAVKKYKWPALKPEQTFCTMAMAYSMGLPGSLEKLAPAIGLDFAKDMEGNRIMLQLSKPKKIHPDGRVEFWQPSEVPEKFERTYSYCKTDTEIERAAEKRMIPLSAKERALWLLDYKINQRGVQIDLRAVASAMDVIEIEKERLDKRMVEVTINGVCMCTANGQLTEWLNYRGIETKSVAKDKVKELLLRKDLPADVREALLLRQEAAKSSTAKLSAMKEKSGVDGRVRQIAQYHGASTGRWSGRGIQVQNFPRPNMKQEDIEAVMQLLN